MSTEFSVLHPLTMGIMRSTKAWLAARRSASGWQRAVSTAAAVTLATARMASVWDFMRRSMRRTSGWRMMATPSRLFEPSSLPCTRSRAYQSACW